MSDTPVISLFLARYPEACGLGDFVTSFLSLLVIYNAEIGPWYFYSSISFYKSICGTPQIYDPTQIPAPPRRHLLFPERVISYLCLPIILIITHEQALPQSVFYYISCICFPHETEGVIQLSAKHSRPSMTFANGMQ